MQLEQTGTIYKSIGGFYYVKTPAGALIECKPRGIFRLRGEKPVAGDRVALATEAGDWYIAEVLPRKNLFVRPPVANVDTVFIVASTVAPRPASIIIDKLCAVAVDNGAQPVLLVTKTDLAAPDDLLDAYQTAGFPAFLVNAATGAGCARVLEMLPGKLSVFCGNSGVGKSTLLNAIAPDTVRETGQISKKLGRGKHTTRAVELFEVCGGLVADTPGFASLDLRQAGSIPAENMQYAFPEIARRMPDCKFSGCAHVAEAGCAVRAALEAGEISQSRYNSYVTLYQEAKEHDETY